MVTITAITDDLSELFHVDFSGFKVYFDVKISKAHDLFIKTN